MKKLFIFIAFITISLNIFAQSPEQLYKIGKKYEYGEEGMGVLNVDYQKALDYYTKSALEDYVPAQKKLVNLYFAGKKRLETVTDVLTLKNFIPKNPQKAFFWAKVLAKNGNAKYQFLVGMLYAEGNGVEKNISQAKYWYEKAADSGIIDAQFNIATLYDDEGNYEKAIYWYKKAAENGKVEAQFNLGIKYNKLKNYKEAFFWYKKAANNGFDRAKVNLGNFYLKGFGVDRNLKLAFNLFKETANKNQKVGQYMLALCYENGWGTEKNINKAIYWLKKSSSNGFTRATKKLKEINNN